ELRRVAEALETGAVSAALAPDLGLEPDELRARIDEELFRFREALELFVEGPEEPGLGVFLAHWSDLVGGLGTRVARSLAAGHTLVVRSDRRLPRAALLLAQAFERAQVDGGPLCVLHGDQPDLDQALAAEPHVRSVRVREADSVLARWRARAASRPETIWELWRVSNASLVVADGADPRAAAEDCGERFVGRSTTLSGQFPGSIARVLCPERIFSRFTEELLASLDRSPDARRPVLALDADLTDHLAHAWALGLDEGATPLYGEDPFGRAGGDGPAGLVFTNVAPRSGLARLTRPAPILALVRVPSGVDAAELQREHDGEPKLPVHGTPQP
ncbi:MAG: aldehyde dehydrogenase family protein, partial [Planctomycetes bacterium]|nr:aldehyde dehydrogenase family protein [Planctomycetota bacterium]